MDKKINVFELIKGRQYPGAICYGQHTCMPSLTSYRSLLLDNSPSELLQQNLLWSTSIIEGENECSSDIGLLMDEHDSMESCLK